jgi:hypothetical protein
MYFITFQWSTHHIHQRGRFSPGTPVSFTNEIDRHNITDILLKVVLSTINQTNPYYTPTQSEILSYYLDIWLTYFLLRSTVIICHLTDDAAWSLDYHEHLELVILSCICKYLKELVFFMHRISQNVLWVEYFMVMNIADLCLQILYFEDVTSNIIVHDYLCIL